MACVGLGLDVVGVEKFARIVEKRGPRFLDRVFTPGERRYCDRKTSRFEAYSTRFAAKEAFLKALGMGLRRGIRWKDLEVTSDQPGKPELKVTGRARDVAEGCGARKCLLSLSHAVGCAMAIVLLED